MAARQRGRFRGRYFWIMIIRLDCRSDEDLLACWEQIFWCDKILIRSVSFRHPSNLSGWHKRSLTYLFGCCDDGDRRHDVVDVIIRLSL